MVAETAVVYDESLVFQTIEWIDVEIAWFWCEYAMGEETQYWFSVLPHMVVEGRIHSEGEVGLAVFDVADYIGRTFQFDDIRDWVYGTSS